MSDFTGERLIPGEVDADLWNEHISRYFFAAALLESRQSVLDAGCGTGYGASLLNRRSRARVLGIDVSPDAISHAVREYSADGVQFTVGRCEQLPVADGSVTCITAFEVIEHLAGWRDFLLESRRVLSPGGLLLVSTPNKAVYAESRGDAGANPFHVHEFDFEEFSRELGGVFSFVRVFGQNHTGSITLTALGETDIQAERESLQVTPESAGYLLAVCSNAPLPPIPNYVFVPAAANTLLERERHIRLLTGEVAEGHHEFATLLERHRAQTLELERSNEWARSLNQRLVAAAESIGRLQNELEESNQWAASLDARLKDAGDRLGHVQAELARSNAWAGALDDQLRSGSARIQDLQTEVEGKNEWALALSHENDARGQRILALQDELEEYQVWAARELAEARAKLSAFESSRWVRIGKTIHVGPLAK